MSEFDAARAELEWRKCMAHNPEGKFGLGDEKQWQHRVLGFEYFCKTYWFIQHPQGQRPFDLWPAQLDTVVAFECYDRNIVLKARQLGYSTLVAAYAFWKAFFWRDRRIVLLSKEQNSARDLLAKAKYGYSHLPTWLKNRGPRALQNNTEAMAFDNDSVLRSMPSREQPARGQTVFLVVLDEWAFFPNPEDAWASVEPIADVGGRVIGISTANGLNFFYTMYQAARGRKNRFNKIFWPWSAGHDRDDEWYAQKERDFANTPWLLHQEYPRDEDEAFVKSGRGVFDSDVLREVATRPPERFWRPEGTWVPSPHAEAPLRVWEPPLPTEDGGTPQPYVMGVDVSAGIGQYSDWSAAYVVRTATHTEPARVVAIWHGTIDADSFGTEVLVPLGRWYNNALLGIEINGPGLTTIHACQRAGYQNLYRERRFRTLSPDGAPVDSLGWRTGTNKTQVLIPELIGAIREGTLTFECAETVQELLGFVQDEKGKMHGSPHDDRVMALGIANQMLGFAHEYDYTAKKHFVQWSPEWFAEMRKLNSPRKRHRLRLGDGNRRSRV